MGKRKPTAPRRRVGAHFLDLAIQRTAFAEASARGEAVASAAATPSVPWLSSAPPTVPMAASTAGVSATPLPSHTAPPTPQSVNMHIQQGRAATAATPHLHHVGKPTVSTVPSLPSAREQNSSPPPNAAPASGGEETVTITLAQLEAWKQRTVLQIEDHFTNEQLKRIAEFGRVHANLVKEAKEYVAGIEAQLKEQFERERESLKQQAEAYVSQFQQENEALRQRVQLLEDELEQIQADQGSESEVLGGPVEQEPGATTADGVLTVDASISANTRSDSSGAPSGHVVVAPADSQLTNENAQRVDAVAETMSRAMGIRTPRVEAMATVSSPKDSLQLAPSPTTTNESSPVDMNSGVLPKEAQESLQQGNPPSAHALAAEDDYL